MLSRSLSSQRRRRASRSAASSPNRLGAPGVGSSASRSPRGSISAASGISALGTGAAGAAGSVSPSSNKTGRRASISAGEGLSGLSDDDLLGRHDRLSVNKTSPRGSQGDVLSPRNSRLSLAPDMDVMEYDRGHRKSIAPELLSGEMSRSSRNTLAPEKSRSPRNSLTPDAAGDYTRRSSLAPDYNRSPRGSLVSESSNRSPRNSLVPEGGGYSRSPRNSLCPDGSTPNRSPRHSLVPDGDGYNRSPRPSIAVDRDGEYSGRSPRPSLLPDGLEQYHRSPRPSMTPEMGESNRSPRPSIVPSDGEFVRGPRPSMIPADVEFNRSPRSSLVPDNGEYNRSPRPSLIPADVEFNRSPRSSLVPEGQDLNRSPRGSIGGDQVSRSPRGSYVQEMGAVSRSPRGSIGPEATIAGSASPYNRSPRGSLGADLNRSPRNSLSPRGSLTGRNSVDLAVAGTSRANSFRSGPANTGPGSGAPGRPVGFGSGWDGPGGSRRASSNPSQVSGDDRRQLCAEHTKLAGESSAGLTSYGSVMYQLKDANIEASGTCDFVLRALRIVYQTVVVTVILVCLSTMPVIMLFMGAKYLHDCPREPHLPVYMLVGGVLGAVRMVWLVFRQRASRRYAQLGRAGLGAAALDSDVAGSLGVRIACGALSCFLIVWFCLGNYWTLSILWPSFAPELYKPNEWCDKTLYVFALVHLSVCYAFLALLVLAALSLSCYQLLLCPLVMRYK